MRLQFQLRDAHQAAGVVLKLLRATERTAPTVEPAALESTNERARSTDAMQIGATSEATTLIGQVDSIGSGLQASGQEGETKIKLARERSSTLDSMLRQAAFQQRRMPSSPASQAKGEPPICLSVWPSLSSTPDGERTTASKRLQLREEAKIKRRPKGFQFHFGPSHLFGAVISLMLATQTPPIRHRPSHTAGSSWPISSLARAEATGDADTAQQHQAGPLLVDTKYWIRDMEFGERDNWRSGLKPCTLIERIAIEQEAAVISLGDSMDALGGAGIESNIRELTLAPTGILLLEEDTVSVGAMDPLFVQYLNQSGDCYDSSLFANQDGAAAAGPGSHPQFHFEPESDTMSWFNPDNWHSALSEMEQISEHTPDSHRIPCSEDVVVFGSRQFSFWPTVQGNERAKTLAFKVNFRAAEADERLGISSNMSSLSSLPSLRVSKLEINEHSYSQAEFDQLIAMYGDQLFQFRDNRSAFGEKFRSDGRQDILVIDDSSIHLNNNDMMELCHEEAGCMCGNEHPDVMRIICSFREPVKPDNWPCRDPIQVTGYCDKVCATSLSIVMDPDKFKESFLVSDVFKHEEGLPKGYFSDHIFVGQRRVDHNIYEIVLRLVPVSDHTYEQTLGRDVELAHRIKKSLERSAIKSFYGIRSISIRSSIDWRRNSQPAIMWVVFAISASIFILVFVQNDGVFPIKPLTRALDMLWAQLVGVLFTNHSNQVGLSQGDSFLSEPVIFDQDETVSEMALDQLHEVDLAAVSLDAQSVTDSTHNLIEPGS